MRLYNNLQLVLLFGALLIISGSAVYYGYQLNQPGLWLSLVLTIIGFTYIKRRYQLRWQLALPQFNPKFFWPHSLYLILWLTAIYFLLQARTDTALISPWEVVSFWFWLAYGLATVWLLILAWRDSAKLTALLILHYLLSFGIAAIVYAIGYGFDPFIHQASVSYIIEHGAILPKTFYYLGQYVLEVGWQQLTGLTVATIDKWLLPLAAAIFLPITAAATLPHLRPRQSRDFGGQAYLNTQNINLLVLLALCLPFSFFIITTPQSLAYLVVIILLLFSLSAVGKFDRLLLWLLAVVCLTLQPIVGLPALFYVSGHQVWLAKIKYRQEILIALFICLLLALPAIFYWLGWQNQVDQPVNSLQFADQTISWQGLSFPNEQSFWLNWLYFYQRNLGWLILALIVGGWLLIYKHKNRQQFWFLCLYQSLGLLAAYGLASQLKFNFLIDYERQNYANRLLYLAILFSLPTILFLADYFLQKLRQQNKIIISAWLAVLTAALLAAGYISYPRLDDYYNSRGYSVSGHDLRAMEWIQADAQNSDYIVLANQQVCAAGLRLNGFAKYYGSTSLTASDSTNQLVFYCSIPTGGPLYQSYLDLTNDATDLAAVRRALSLTAPAGGQAKAQRAYFVLNKYWRPFPKILAEAKFAADSYQAIDNGEVYVFKFDQD